MEGVLNRDLSSLIRSFLISNIGEEGGRYDKFGLYFVARYVLAI